MGLCSSKVSQLYTSNINFKLVTHILCIFMFFFHPIKMCFVSMTDGKHFPFKSSFCFQTSIIQECDFFTIRKDIKVKVIHTLKHTVCV